MWKLVVHTELIECQPRKDETIIFNKGMLRHICQLQLISIWKPVVHTELTERQPRKDVLVNTEGMDVSGTQFLGGQEMGQEQRS